MRALNKIRLRVRPLLHHGRLEHELDRELRFHLDQQIEKNLASGMAPDESRAAGAVARGPASDFCLLTSVF
jgi:hypothetical protein